MNWKQDGRGELHDGNLHQKKFVVCTIRTSPLGYMLLMEERTLEQGDGQNFTMKAITDGGDRFSNLGQSFLKEKNTNCSESRTNSWSLS